MITITFDIETLPDMREGKRDEYIRASRENFRAPSGLTKEQAASDLGLTDPQEIKFTSKDAMLARWSETFRDEKAEEVGDAEWRKTSFDGSRGMICVIGAAIDGADPVSFWRTDYLRAESDMLREFLPLSRRRAASTTWRANASWATTLRTSTRGSSTSGQSSTRFPCRFGGRTTPARGIRKRCSTR